MFSVISAGRYCSYVFCHLGIAFLFPSKYCASALQRSRSCMFKIYNSKSDSLNLLLSQTHSAVLLGSWEHSFIPVFFCTLHGVECPFFFGSGATVQVVFEPFGHFPFSAQSQSGTWVGQLQPARQIFQLTDLSAEARSHA